MLLESHLDRFAEKEGFKNVDDCFKAIDAAVKQDKVTAESNTKKLVKQLK